MSINTPANNKVDWRKNVMLDEEKNRAISVNLQQSISLSLTHYGLKYRMKNYTNTLQVRNAPF